MKTPYRKAAAFLRSKGHAGADDMIPANQVAAYMAEFNREVLAQQQRIHEAAEEMFTAPSKGWVRAAMRNPTATGRLRKGRKA